MRILTVALMVITATAFCSEITFRPLGEVISWAGGILVGEVTANEITSTETRITVDLTLDVTEVLLGEFDTADQIICTYTIPVPEIRNEEGEVTGSVSFSVYGSGMEFSLNEGDMVIALIEPHAHPAGTICNLIRIESLDSRKTILSRLLLAGRIQLP